VSVLLDGLQQSLLLSLEVGIILSPDSNEQLGAGLYSSGYSICQSIAVRAGVESDTFGVARKAPKLIEGEFPF
jgi:hypothetical protein